MEINTLFYKFKKLENLESLKIELLEKCVSLELKGKILIAQEGINGNLTGKKEKIEKVQEFLNNKFGYIFFKDGETYTHNFKRMIVKIRKEIITFKQDLDLEKVGQNLAPEELKKWYENDEDFVIIDGRNNYEYDVGHFKNAIKIDTDKFTEFTKEIAKIKKTIADRKVVYYCTGGVRCEKVTSYMIKEGFDKDKTYQLDGGIITYGEKCSDKFFEGKMFVFDERGAIELDKKKQLEVENTFTKCKICYLPEDTKYNCKVSNKEFIMCPKCYNQMEGCYDKFYRNLKNDNSNSKLKVNLVS